MPLAIWPDLKPVANVFGGQEEKFLQRARVPVDAAHGATLAAFGWVLEWVVLARLPCLQALSNRFSFLLSGHGGNICWLFYTVTVGSGTSIQVCGHQRKAIYRHLDGMTAGAADAMSKARDPWADQLVLNM